MGSIPMPRLFSGFVGSCDLGVSALTNQIGQWSKHFTLSCPDVSVVLVDAQKPMELFNILRQ
jgi:hypothetical protein